MFTLQVGVFSGQHEWSWLEEMSVTRMRVLGIDPGIARMGYGIVQMEGHHLEAVAFGCIETPAHTPVAERLQQIYEELTQVITTHRPDVMAVEELFFYKNTTTAFIVGEARGVALLCGVQGKLPISEYTPMQVKQAVVGYGKAEKRQIQDMVRILLNLQERPKPDDVADALAIAITHAHAAPLVTGLAAKLRRIEGQPR